MRMVIIYNPIFPVPVHSLAYDLTIYTLEVAYPNDQLNANIGGPHEYYDEMVGQVVNASRLMVSPITISE